MADVVPPAVPDALVNDLRAIIVQGRGRAAVAVNAEVVRTYWQIGERIVREEQGATRSAYGEGGLARLGAILSREFGRGFAERSLQNMRQFYLAYPIASTLRTELGWSHYRTLMRLTDAQRRFYEQVAAASRWSSRELDKQINNTAPVSTSAVAKSGSRLAMRTSTLTSCSGIAHSSARC